MSRQSLGRLRRDISLANRNVRGHLFSAVEVPRVSRTNVFVENSVSEADLGIFKRFVETRGCEAVWQGCNRETKSLLGQFPTCAACQETPYGFAHPAEHRLSRESYTGRLEIEEQRHRWDLDIVLADPVYAHCYPRENSELSKRRRC